MQPSLLGWSDMLAELGGFWVDRHSRRFAMGLLTEHRGGIAAPVPGNTKRSWTGRSAPLRFCSPAPCAASVLRLAMP